jgi:N-glycosidase YbiA
MSVAPILGFFDEYRFLSNFWYFKVPIIEKFNGAEFRHKTVEHAFQSRKSNNLAVKIRLSRIPRPGDVKKEAKNIVTVKDWDSIKDEVMLELVRAKFFNNAYLADLLLSTGDRPLYEVNYWGDRYWGCDDKLNGENRLGKILMRVREELRSQNK